MKNTKKQIHSSIKQKRVSFAPTSFTSLVAGDGTKWEGHWSTGWKGDWIHLNLLEVIPSIMDQGYKPDQEVLASYMSLKKETELKIEHEKARKLEFKQHEESCRIKAQKTGKYVVFASNDYHNTASIGTRYWLMSPNGVETEAVKGFSQSSPFSKGGYDTNDEAIIEAIEAYENR